MTKQNQNKMGFKGRVIKIVLLVFLVSLLALSIRPALADELSDQIETKKQEMNEVNSKINDLKSYIEGKQKELDTLKSQLGIIDSKIELIQLQIKASEIEIEKTGAEIEKTEQDIKAKEEEIARQKAMIDNVIRELYKEKDSNILEVIVGSTNFSELVERTEYLSKIRSSLKENLDKLNILKDELEKKRVELENTKKNLEELKKQKEEEEKTFEDQKYTKAKIIEVTRGQEAEYQLRLSQARAEEQAVSAEITRLVQEQARRRRAEAVAGRPGREQVVMQGNLNYPLVGINRISITGGDYMDASYGMGFPHRGIDLAASQGTPIMAAGAGTIVAAYDSGGAGLSYIAIDHGNGLITKYLHVSAIYVTAGDVVNAGDVIGLTGGTPGSRGAGIFTTGAHLHFEINDYNGNALNPHNYLSFAPPLF